VVTAVSAAGLACCCSRRSEAVWRCFLRCTQTPRGAAGRAADAVPAS